MANTKYNDFHSTWITMHLEEDRSPTQIARRCDSGAAISTIRAHLIRAGTLVPSKRDRKPIIERLRAMIDTSPGHGPSGECHLFTGGTTTAGYGQIWDSERCEPRYTHHVAWEHAHGITLPEEMQADDRVIMHTCDQPDCCNDQHLRLATHVRNMRDMNRKGRGNAVLTPQDAYHIKLMKARHEDITQAQLADLFDVQPSVISNVMLERTYADIDIDDDLVFTEDGYVADRWRTAA